MRNSRDWRPPTLDVESIARDAVLARIEDKLDALVSHLLTQSGCAVDLEDRDHKAARTSEGKL